MSQSNVSPFSLLPATGIYLNCSVCPLAYRHSGTDAFTANPNIRD
ncbi:hypothetical protein [Musicola paradisiaca]|uniref:Uncharacterized protein n=1 Tax=Musicola paradisiaca (strain Ech703) TaxID=579405 RepID=C6CDS9_MUSP7|nr:hypothetical protein [Musicola paradisiaca]ACS85196.1 hypothetical protein Dd703_1394 [Musicola paradisiaca Ech703]